MRLIAPLFPGETIIGGSDEPHLIGERGGLLLTDRRVFRFVRNQNEAGSEWVKLEDIRSVKGRTATVAAKLVIGLMLAGAGLFLLLEMRGGAQTDLMGLVFFLAGSVLAIGTIRGRRDIAIAISCPESWVEARFRRRPGGKGADAIVEEIETARMRRLEAIAAQGGAPPDPAAVIAEVQSRLAAIAGLLAQGIITQAEHDAKRAKVIDGI